jgi:hypothetical protein
MLKDFSKIHTFNKKKVDTRMNAFEIFKQIYMNYDNVFILESLTGAPGTFGIFGNWI